MWNPNALDEEDEDDDTTDDDHTSSDSDRDSTSGRRKDDLLSPATERRHAMSLTDRSSVTQALDKRHAVNVVATLSGSTSIASSLRFSKFSYLKQKKPKINQIYTFCSIIVRNLNTIQEF